MYCKSLEMSTLGLWGQVPDHCWLLIEIAFLPQNWLPVFVWEGCGSKGPKGPKLKGWYPVSLGEVIRPCQISLLSFRLQANGLAQNQGVYMTHFCQKASPHSFVDFYIKTVLLLGPRRLYVYNLKDPGVWVQTGRAAPCAGCGVSAWLWA